MSSLTYDTIQSLVSDNVFERGKRYFYEGRVGQISFDGSKYTAKVHGTEIYHVSIWQEDNEWFANCTCPL